MLLGQDPPRRHQVIKQGKGSELVANCKVRVEWRKKAILMQHIRYSVAACQTDLPNPIERRQMRANTDRMLSMIDSAVGGSAPFLPVRLVVFPEFAHSAPVFETVSELFDKLAITIPNEHTERIEQKAREHNVYIQTGSMIEVDSKWPGRVFNTT